MAGCNDRLDAVIGRIGLDSHDLGSFLSGIELCAYICRVGYFDAQI